MGRRDMAFAHPADAVCSDPHAAEMEEAAPPCRADGIAFEGWRVHQARGHMAGPLHHSRLVLGQEGQEQARRFGGAAVAPWLAGVLGEHVSVHLPYWVGAAAVLLGAGVLFLTRPHLVHIDEEEDELDELTDEATAVTVGSDS